MPTTGLAATWQGQTEAGVGFVIPFTYPGFPFIRNGPIPESVP